MFTIINKKQLFVSLIIAATSFLGDKYIESHSNPLVLAICDNVTHALIGILTWIGTLLTRTFKTDIYFFIDIFLCGLCSSIIDFDHFIAAKSLNLKDATSLKNRPFLHCTSLAILIVLCVLLFSSLYKINWLHKFGWILAIALLSHHIRDGKRRGFWLYPFGHTKPIPNAIHLLLQMFLPQILCLMINKFSFEIHKSEWVTRIEIV